MQAAVQKLKDGGFIARSLPKGLRESTPKGSELGKKLLLEVGSQNGHQ